jgi:hypothetical protein
MMLFAAWSSVAEAGCKITVYVQNPGKKDLQVWNYSSQTGAKSKGGLWRALKKGYWFPDNSTFMLKPGQKKGTNYSANFRCKAKRRYRIMYRCSGFKNHWVNKFYAYYPSATGWTTNTRITIPLRECG